MDPLVAGLIVALFLSVLVILCLLVYRAEHPWTTIDLERARQKSVAASHAAVSGRVQEHLAPMFPEFTFNPRDARFLGSPVDFVVFDGLDEGDLRQVVFIEVKTNKAGLTHRERLVREAVQAKRVEWRLMRLPGSPDQATPQAEDHPPTDAAA